MERPDAYIELRKLIKMMGGLDDKFSSVVFRNLLEVIQYCHSMGVLHRDIKPSNILVHPNTGEIKLVDFGCAIHFSMREYSICKGKNEREHMDVIA